MSKICNTKRWFLRHISDYYVIKSNKLNYRNRSSFKIIEIQEKYKLFKKNMFVIEFGSGKGGWSEQILRYIGERGTLIALDLLKMPKISGVKFIQGDLFLNKTYQYLNNIIDNKKVHCIISDVLPNLSGNKILDQANSIYLLKIILNFVNLKLNKNGFFITKIFQGSGVNEYIESVKKTFNKVIQFKPKSSKSKSREFYIIAKKFKY